MASVVLKDNGIVIKKCKRAIKIREKSKIK